MIKQVIVVRKDLKMRRGKEIAQGAHASIAWLTNRIKLDGLPGRDGEDFVYDDVRFSSAERAWIQDRFTKVVVQVDSEAALMEVHEAALKAGLVSELIVDAGATEFHGVPTPTCCAIGPDEDIRIDPVTKHLKLY